MAAIAAIYPHAPSIVDSQPSTPTTSWEDLNHQAKAVEAQLDTLLGTLARAQSMQATQSATLAIDNALAHLYSILEAQSALIASGLGVPATASATAQRHRDILAEYQREYKRTRQILETKPPGILTAVPSSAPLLAANPLGKDVASYPSSTNDSTDHIIEYCTL